MEDDEGISMKGSLSPLASLRCSEKGTKDILEQAKEELQILEAQQPDRFNYLKLELKSFISSLESRSLILSEDKCKKLLTWANDSTSVAPSSSSSSSSSSVTTQASSTCKKRKKVILQNQEIMEEGLEHKFQRGDRLDEVFERARACIHKIRKFKHELMMSGEN